MIFVYSFYNLHSLHQHVMFNPTSFETVLSVYEMKMNLCYEKLEPFRNVPVPKTFFDESRLEIDLFVKWELFKKMRAEYGLRS